MSMVDELRQAGPLWALRKAAADRIKVLERAALWHVMHSNGCHPGDACPDSAPCGCREECENMIDEASK